MLYTTECSETFLNKKNIRSTLGYIFSELWKLNYEFDSTNVYKIFDRYNREAWGLFNNGDFQRVIRLDRETYDVIFFKVERDEEWFLCEPLKVIEENCLFSTSKVIGRLPIPKE